MTEPECEFVADNDHRVLPTIPHATDKHLIQHKSLCLCYLCLEAGEVQDIRGKSTEGVSHAGHCTRYFIHIYYLM